MLRLYFGFHCFLLCYFKFSPLRWSEFKGTVPSLDDGYFFSNILDIKSSIFSLDFINPSNQKRLDLIFKLHKEGKTNKEIVHHLKIHKIKRRNKDDNYSVKDVFMCIKKLKKREERMKDIKYKLGKWKLWREY